MKLAVNTTLRMAALSAVLVVATSSVAFAGPIRELDFQLESDGSEGFGRIEIDGSTATVTIPVLGVCVDGFSPCFGGPGTHYDLRGNLQVVSGPLTRMDAIVFGGLPSTYYEFGASTFRLDLEWALPAGGVQQGGLVLPLATFGFTVVGEDVVGDSDYPYVFEFFALGQGLLDAHLASYLGVAPHVRGGSFFLWAEPVLGEPGGFRLGDTHTPRLTVAVPEPALPMMAATALVAALARRRRLRARGDRPITRP